jgi:hypothetical protein
MNKHFDTPTIIIIVITFVLFTIALFTKGLTHDLLLEAGVFLVSVKLIMMGYHHRLTTQNVLKKLSEIKEVIKEIKNQDRTHE